MTGPDLPPAAWVLLATCGLLCAAAVAVRIGYWARDRREVRRLLDGRGWWKW